MPRRIANSHSQVTTLDYDNAVSFAKQVAKNKPVMSSPLIDERRTEAGSDEDPCKPEYETGTVCPECNSRQYRCTSGITCREGHGFGNESGIPVPECEPESRRSITSEQLVESPPVNAIAEDTPEQFENHLQGPSMSDACSRIIERIFNLDVEDVYERLERELKLSSRASNADRATIADALDRAQDNARDAHRLYASMRVDLEAFELDAKASLADMRAQATARLEDDRTSKHEEKKRAKQITEADIEAWISATFFDEWRDLQIRRKRAEKSVEHIERIAELWKTRSRTLEALLAAARV